MKSFLLRHKELSQIMSENVKRARCAVTIEEMKAFFENLRKTNFTDDRGTNKVPVIAKRGVKHVERITDHSKTSTSIMIAAAPNGTVLSPYTVYKAKHIYPGWREGGMQGSVYNSNSSGWFDLRMFCDWFNKILLPYARKLDGRRVIVCDNLCSHLSVDVISSL
ncbi:hypothetical protein ANN_10719 [Periplaneta americana]|uniref:DDE-1 domain-containing protein n=1 Tax=Periplaneta americana TaxID=6978 RepID=A0ABQ8T4R6_PERAM|nr:hypothetical protein ANN_10719 [Periplaneta americana]